MYIIHKKNILLYISCCHYSVFREKCNFHRLFIKLAAQPAIYLNMGKYIKHHGRMKFIQTWARRHPFWGKVICGTPCRLKFRWNNWSYWNIYSGKFKQENTVRNLILLYQPVRTLNNIPLYTGWPIIFLHPGTFNVHKM